MRALKTTALTLALLSSPAGLAQSVSVDVLRESVVNPGGFDAYLQANPVGSDFGQCLLTRTPDEWTRRTAQCSSVGDAAAKSLCFELLAQGAMLQWVMDVRAAASGTAWTSTSSSKTRAGAQEQFGWMQGTASAVLSCPP